MTRKRKKSTTKSKEQKPHGFKGIVVLSAEMKNNFVYVLYAEANCSLSRVLGGTQKK